MMVGILRLGTARSQRGGTRDMTNVTVVGNVTDLEIRHNPRQSRSISRTMSTGIDAFIVRLSMIHNINVDKYRKN